MVQCRHSFGQKISCLVKDVREKNAAAELGELEQTVGFLAMVVAGRSSDHWRVSITRFGLCPNLLSSLKKGKEMNEVRS